MRLTQINPIKATICTARGREQLYLDEIENRARCKAQGCRDRMRMAMDRQEEMSGFVGGLRDNAEYSFIQKLIQHNMFIVRTNKDGAVT